MASLAALARIFGNIPRRINDAMYEEDPILRERVRRETIRMPGPFGEPTESEVDIPTGEPETAGLGPKRLSKFGVFAKQALPEILRGGIIAASNPTRGQVGTAGDIFGALGAVREDREGRQMRDVAMQRQQRQDAQGADYNRARTANLDAETELRKAQAQAELNPPQKKLQEDVFATRDRFIALGQDPETALKNALSVVLKQFHPEIGAEARKGVLEKQAELRPVPRPTVPRPILWRPGVLGASMIGAGGERTDIAPPPGVDTKPSAKTERPRTRTVKNDQGEYVNISADKPGPTGVKGDAPTQKKQGALAKIAAEMGAAAPPADPAEVKAYQAFRAKKGLPKIGDAQAAKELAAAKAKKK